MRILQKRGVGTSSTLSWSIVYEEDGAAIYKSSESNCKDYYLKARCYTGTLHIDDTSQTQMCISIVRPVTDVASLVEISSTPEMLTVRYIRYFRGLSVD